MKKVLVVIFVLLNAVFTFSQTPADWQKFSPDGEEFVVEVPQKMQESVNWREVDENEYTYSLADYRKYFNGVYYFIFSENSLPKYVSTNPELSEPLKSFINEFDKEPETVKLGDFNGIKYEFKDSEDFYHTIIFVKTNNRSYRFHTIQEESLSSDAKRFVNSIHLFQEVLKPKTYDIKYQIISLNNLEYFNFPEHKTFGQNHPKPVEDSGLTPIKFDFKPGANYTDLARFYGLMGTTAFNVELLANGKIGKITPLKRIPFGLTTAAINAIKRIKFQPAMRDGVAVSVTKQLQYSFTLY